MSRSSVSPNYESDPEMDPNAIFEDSSDDDTSMYQPFWQRWGWVRGLLARWTQEEGAPYHETHIPPSHQGSDPLTGEPMRDTMYTLIARIRRHEDRISNLLRVVQPLISINHRDDGSVSLGIVGEVKGLREDCEDLRATTELVRQRVDRIDNRNHELSEQVETLESRMDRMEALRMADLQSFAHDRQWRS